MLSTERKQWLHDQVFLTIINDSTAHNRLSPFIPSKLINIFRHKANDERHRLCREEDSQMTGEERRYVNLLLWEYWGGELSDHVLRDLDEYLGTYRKYITDFMCITASQSQSEPIKEETMNPTAELKPAFETKHFVFGTNIADMTEAQLIDAIKQVEGEIADLKAVKTKSSRIAAKVKELDDMLAKIVEALDKK